MNTLTERQEWALAYAIHHNYWVVAGRGGMMIARGLEQRGLGRVDFRRVLSVGLVHVFEPNDEGRAFAKRHKLAVVT